MSNKRNHGRGFVLLRCNQVALAAPFNLQEGTGEFNRAIRARHWLATLVPGLTEEEKCSLSAMQQVRGWRIGCDIQELLQIDG